MTRRVSATPAWASWHNARQHEHEEATRQDAFGSEARAEPTTAAAGPAAAGSRLSCGSSVERRSTRSAERPASRPAGTPNLETSWRDETFARLRRRAEDRRNRLQHVLRAAAQRQRMPRVIHPRPDGAAALAASIPHRRRTRPRPARLRPPLQQPLVHRAARRFEQPQRTTAGFVCGHSWLERSPLRLQPPARIPPARANAGRVASAGVSESCLPARTS